MEREFVHAFGEGMFGLAMECLALPKLQAVFADGCMALRGETDEGAATTFLVKRLTQCFVEKVSGLSKDGKRLAAQLDTFSAFWDVVFPLLPKINGDSIRTDDKMRQAATALYAQIEVVVATSPKHFGEQVLATRRQGQPSLFS